MARGLSVYVPCDAKAEQVIASRLRISPAPRHRLPAGACTPATTTHSPHFAVAVYLHSLAGIYEAVVQPEVGDEAIFTLRLYPDGTCLFSEKTIGGPSGGASYGGMLISTGRWDHSDFSEGVTLHLKSQNGTRRVMSCSQDTGTDGLIYCGQGDGPGGLTLIKR